MKKVLPAHLFVSKCAPDTAITEMAGCLGGDFVDSIRQIVQNCQGQNGRTTYKLFPKGTNEEVWREEMKGTAVDEEALLPARSSPWKKSRAFRQTGRTSLWQIGAQEEDNEERWK